MEVHDIAQETRIKTIPKKKKWKKAKWLSQEALKITEKRRESKNKGEKERYTHLNAEFQRIARRYKKGFLGDHCEEIEEKSKMWKTRDLFKNFQFVVIYTVKGFGVINKAEDVFLVFSCFFDDPMAIWSLVPLPFLNPVCTCGSSRFTYYWSLAWRILSNTLLACEMNAILWYFEHSLTLPFFGIGMNTWKLIPNSIR